MSDNSTSSLPSLTNEQLLEIISNMTVKDIVELTEMMREKFGVSAQQPMVAMVAESPSAAAAVEEKTIFDVYLNNAGTNKINVIKVVRTITNLGLKEAKELVDKAPVLVKDGLSKADAEALIKQLSEAGAESSMK